MNTTTAPAITLSAHALDRCQGERAIPPAAVLAIVRDKLSANTTSDVAVLVYTFPSAKGNYNSLTASNGDNLWAIVRDNVITTCFFRRSSQPSGKAELQVKAVVR